MSEATVTCGLCENAITLGTLREIRNAEPAHTYCARLEDARESYHFTIQNPDEDPRVSFGLWYVEGDREYAILSNTGGMTVWASSSREYGEGALPMKREFVEAFGLGWHWLMCYRPVREDRIVSAFEDIERDYYDGVMADHEKWALFRLLGRALLSDAPLPYEWQPMIDFADTCTKLTTPEVREAP